MTKLDGLIAAREIEVAAKAMFFNQCSIMHDHEELWAKEPKAWLYRDNAKAALTAIAAERKSAEGRDSPANEVSLLHDTFYEACKTETSSEMAMQVVLRKLDALRASPPPAGVSEVFDPPSNPDCTPESAAQLADDLEELLSEKRTIDIVALVSYKRSQILAALRASPPPAASETGAGVSEDVRTRGNALAEYIQAWWSDSDDSADTPSERAIKALIAERELAIAALRSRPIEAASDPWVDTRIIRFDDSAMFGLGGFYFDAWESRRWEMHTKNGSYAVWKSGGRTWSMYGTYNGVLALDRYSSEAHAKADAEQYALSIDASIALRSRPDAESGKGTFEEGWKPIETAPKTGEEIILAWSGQVLTGNWLDNSKSIRPWAGWKPTGMRMHPDGKPSAWQPLPALRPAPSVSGKE